MQDRIYYIKQKNTNLIVNKELNRIFNSIKYTNKLINDIEYKLYNFNNNSNSYHNTLTIYYNIPLLKKRL